MKIQKLQSTERMIDNDPYEGGYDSSSVEMVNKQINVQNEEKN